MSILRGRKNKSADGSLPAPALARVLELVQAVGAESHPEDVLDTAIDAAVDLTDAERGWILIAREDQGFEVAAARRRGGVDLEEPLAKVSRTVVEQCLQENLPLCVDEARVHAQLSAAQSVAEMKLRAVLCVPFRLDQARGVFYLDNRFASGIFNEMSLQLLTAFCGPVAMILRHVDLEKRLAASAEALTRSNRDLDTQLRDRTAEVQRLESLTVGGSEASATHPFHEIMGKSPVLLRALGELYKAAEGDYPVVLRGESGTGKDLAARALHRVSGRQDQYFVPVSCGGLNPFLLEAELFGVQKGAYTGAEEDRPGLFQSVGKGTLYLDGLESLPLELQPKLLRVLEDGTFRPVGGGTETRCEARIVSATRADLQEWVDGGKFREDLYYRLRVLEIRMPSLRERGADIELLWQHFLDVARQQTGLEVADASMEVMQKLKQHHWPGNIRELANLATRWVALGGQLPAEEWQSMGKESVDSPAADSNLRDLADRKLREVLQETGGNKAEAARRLGISRRTLYNRLKELE